MALDNTTELGAEVKRQEEALRDIQRGIVQTIGAVTLTNAATSTTVTHYGCSSKSAVVLVPANADAAAEYAAGTTYVTPAKGEFVITHPNAATTRTYRYVFFSGIRQ